MAVTLNLATPLLKFWTVGPWHTHHNQPALLLIALANYQIEVLDYIN